MAPKKSKKKAVSAADEEAIARVQAKVAVAWKKDADGLIKTVTDLTAGASSGSTQARLELQAGIYLLLRRLPDRVGRSREAKEKEAQLPEKERKAHEKLHEKQWQQGQQKLYELVPKAVAALQAAQAEGSRPSVVLAGLTAMALNSLRKDIDKRQQLAQWATEAFQPFFSDGALEAADRFLEQWQPPSDYPTAAAAAAEQDAWAGKGARQLTAHLAADVVQAVWAAILTDQPDNAMRLMALRLALKTIQEEQQEDSKPAVQKKGDVAQQLQRDVGPTPQQQQQGQGQQGGKQRGKDTDKVLDAKRGRGGDNEAARRLAEHKDALGEANEKIAKVVTYLKDATLAGDKQASSQEQQQQHLSKLQAEVCLDLQKVRDAVPPAKGAGAAGAAAGGGGKAGGEATKDKDAAIKTEISTALKAQFGTAGWTDDKVQNQLTDALTKGSWLVYCDSQEDKAGVISASGNSSSSSGKSTLYYSSLTEFAAHVEQQHLAGKSAEDELKELGLKCHSLGPPLATAFRPDFGDKLHDSAARALRSSSKGGGGAANGVQQLQDNPWVQAFKEECPLRRYLHNVASAYICVEPVDGGAAVVPPPPELSAELLKSAARVGVATGFALLQLQRGAVAVSAQELSYAPDWAVKAFHMLKALVPAHSVASGADLLDVLTHGFFSDESQVEGTQDLRCMLDPSLHKPATAAAASKGDSSGGGSSSSEPSFSDGLVEDTVTMLELLHSARALDQGPLQLALQVYVFKAVGAALPLPSRSSSSSSSSSSGGGSKPGGSKLGKADEIRAVLGQLDNKLLLELRSFLLQALDQHYARLPKYQEFLQALADKRWKPRHVPVVQQGDNNNKRFLLSPDFYAQACMSAAVPFRHNKFCCLKHARMREIEEGEGRAFDPMDAANPDDSICADDLLPPSDRAKLLPRYLVKASRVAQAQQEQGLAPGTQQGVEALTRELFLPSQFDDVAFGSPAPWTFPLKISWDLPRFYLVLASQLSVHREQLQALIGFHEESMAEPRSSRDATMMRHAERALLQQRVAGLAYSCDAWCKWYKKLQQQLQHDLEQLSKTKPQAQHDKGGPKAGAGSKDKEEKAKQDKENKEKMDELHAQIDKVVTAMASLDNLSRDLLKQSDMTAAAVETWTTSSTQPDLGLHQALDMVVRELINPRPASEQLLASNVRKALQLCRLMLFQLDVTIFHYVNQAHAHVLALMWRGRQPAAALSVVRYALTRHMHEKSCQQNLDELLKWDEDSKAKAATTKAAKKTAAKKKKAAAAKQVVAAHASDQEDSDQEQEAAAAAAAEAAAEAEESDGEDADAAAAQPGGEPDPEQLINLSYLEPQFTRPEPAGSRGGKAAAAPPAAAAAAPASPPAAAAAAPAPAAAAAAPPEQASSSSRSGRGKKSKAAAAAGPKPYPRDGKVQPNGVAYAAGPHGEMVFVNTNSGAVCWRCGALGHIQENCQTPQCQLCNKWGHDADRCDRACRDCGRLHARGAKCTMGRCRECGMCGHLGRQCPSVQCKSCGRYAHMSSDCPRCKNCGNDHLTPAGRQMYSSCCWKCKQMGHSAGDCKAKHCDVCKQWGKGCVVGNCVGVDDSAAAAAPGGGSSSRGVPPPQHARAGAAAAGPAAAAAPPAAPAAPPLPANVQLLPPRATDASGDAFMARLTAIPSDRVSTFACTLFEYQDKLQTLLRVPEAVMEQWLTSDDPVFYLEGVLQHVARTAQQRQQPPRQQQPQQPQQQPSRSAEPRSSSGSGRMPAAQQQQQQPDYASPYGPRDSTGSWDAADGWPQGEAAQQQQQPRHAEPQPPPQLHGQASLGAAVDGAADGAAGAAAAGGGRQPSKAPDSALKAILHNKQKQLAQREAPAPPAPNSYSTPHSPLQPQQPPLGGQAQLGAQGSAAANPMLPPHLRHTAGAQQPPGAAAAFPPHLPFLQQQQQQQHHQQQQPAGDDEDSGSDDNGHLYALLTADQPQQQPPPADGPLPSNWADVTGHAMDEDASRAAEYPPLGAAPQQQQQAGDADMEQALAASRADAAAVAAASSRPTALPGVSAAGLANQAGEYNCFLNVVVQCLYSCKSFTDQVRDQFISYDAHPVVQALVGLFKQMEDAESGWQPGGDRAVINPNELRLALANKTRFQCQEMNDANELLDTIYECFAESQHHGSTQGSRGILIDGVFGLRLTESVQCRVCGKETHKVPEHFEHLVVVNSVSLSMAAIELGSGTAMDQLLKFLFAQEQKYCDKDEGGCGAANARFRKLMQCPQVLTLQLVWDQQVSGDEIRGVLSHVEEVLDITSMYDNLEVSDTTFKLTSAVAYYGQHYMAFVFNNKLNSWLMFDDANVSAVGSWQDVIAKCGAGRIQPGVLFYKLFDIESLPDTAVQPAARSAHMQQQHQQHQQQPAAVVHHHHHNGPYAGSALELHQQHQQQPAGPPVPDRGLAATSTWGNAGGQQQRAAAAGPGPAPWAAAPQPAGGFDPSHSGGMVGPVDGDIWSSDSAAELGSSSTSAWPPMGASSSTSISSTSGPPSAGAPTPAAAAAARTSSGGDPYGSAGGSAAWPGLGAAPGGGPGGGRSSQTGTGPAAAPARLAASAMRAATARAPAASTGPKAAGSSLNPRAGNGTTAGGPTAGPPAPERSGGSGSGGFGPPRGDHPGPGGGGRPGRGPGGRPPGRGGGRGGGGESEEWGGGGGGGGGGRGPRGGPR